MSALVTAAGVGDVVKVQRLLKEGASINELDGKGDSAMVRALVNGHTPVMKCLIKEGGADINAVITMGEQECSFLSWAITFCNYPLAQ
jgi:hypothetical protein